MNAVSACGLAGGGEPAPGEKGLRILSIVGRTIATYSYLYGSHRIRPNRWLSVAPASPAARSATGLSDSNNARQRPAGTGRNQLKIQANQWLGDRHLGRLCPPTQGRMIKLGHERWNKPDPERVNFSVNYFQLLRRERLSPGSRRSHDHHRARHMAQAAARLRRRGTGHLSLLLDGRQGAWPPRPSEKQLPAHARGQGTRRRRGETHGAAALAVDVGGPTAWRPAGRPGYLATCDQLPAVE